MDDDNGNEWLTIRQAAKRVGRSDRTIRRALADGHLVAQRSGTGSKSPWLVSSSSLFGTFPEVDPTQAPEPPPAASSDLVKQLGTLVELLADANRARQELAERAARAEAQAEHLRERLAELRASEPPTPTPTRKARWWTRTHS